MQKTIFWTLQLVLIMALMNIGSWLSWTPIDNSENYEGRNVASNLTPRSAELAQIENVKQEPTVSIVSLDCQHFLPHAKNAISTTPSMRMIRFTGKFCHETNNYKNLGIKNVTTQLDSTMFVSKNATFSTEYVSLEPGENKFLITYEGQAGQTVATEVVIARQN